MLVDEYKGPQVCMSCEGSRPHRRRYRWLVRPGRLRDCLPDGAIVLCHACIAELGLMSLTIDALSADAVGHGLVRDDGVEG